MVAVGQIGRIDLNLCVIMIPIFRSWDEEKQWAFLNLPLHWRNLNLVSFSVDDITSENTSSYNCIAYAAKDYTQKWWPYEKWMPEARHFHWPVPPVYPATVENFYDAFRTKGFEPCKDGNRQPGYEKVAIYVDGNNSPQHMARELGDGVWHSKLGGCQDIRHHALIGVEDYCNYGKARYFMRKQLPTITKWQIIKARLRDLLGR